MMTAVLLLIVSIDMRDRFLFRVYDTLRREYLSAGKVMIEVKAKLYPTESPLFLDGDKYECDDRMILEQCTGLKDKNDKRIFEGDILKYVKRHAGSLGPKSYIKEVVYDIYEDNEGWEDQNHLGFNVFGMALIDVYKTSEVIGNVRDNPKLLGQS